MFDDEDRKKDRRMERVIGYAFAYFLVVATTLLLIGMGVALFGEGLTR